MRWWWTPSFPPICIKVYQGNYTCSGRQIISRIRPAAAEKWNSVVPVMPKYLLTFVSNTAGEINFDLKLHESNWALRALIFLPHLVSWPVDFVSNSSLLWWLCLRLGIWKLSLSPHGSSRNRSLLISTPHWKITEMRHLEEFTFKCLAGFSLAGRLRAKITSGNNAG